MLGRNAVLKRICRFPVRWFCQPLVLSQSFCLETKVQSKDSTNVSFLLLILNKEWRCPWACQRGWPESAWPPSEIFDSNGLRLIMQYASLTSRCVVTHVGGSGSPPYKYKCHISQIQMSHHKNTRVNIIQYASPTSRNMVTRVRGSRLSPPCGQPGLWLGKTITDIPNQWSQWHQTLTHKEFFIPLLTPDLPRSMIPGTLSTTLTEFTAGRM